MRPTACTHGYLHPERRPAQGPDLPVSVQDETSRRGFVVDELRRSAVDVGTATVSMPQRVQRINTTMARLEAGTLRPRVRVLESERADRRNGLLQVCSGA